MLINMTLVVELSSARLWSIINTSHEKTLIKKKNDTHMITVGCNLSFLKGEKNIKANVRGSGLYVTRRLQCIKEAVYSSFSSLYIFTS